MTDRSISDTNLQDPLSVTPVFSPTDSGKVQKSRLYLFLSLWGGGVLENSICRGKLNESFPYSSLEARPVTSSTSTSIMSRHRLVWLSLAQMSLASSNILATVVMMINFNFQSQYNWSLYSGPWVGNNNNSSFSSIIILVLIRFFSAASSYFTTGGIQTTAATDQP